MREFPRAPRNAPPNQLHETVYHETMGRMILAVLQRGRGVEDKGGPDWVAGDRRKTERLGASGEEFVPPGESGCYLADFGDEGFLI